METAQIYPGRYLDLTDPEQARQHAIEGVGARFVMAMQPGDMIVTATNFGCGASREHAAVALKTLGLGAVLAESFARIFYRNAINLGLLLQVCPGIAQQVNRGDVLSVDLSTGKVINQSTGLATAAQPLSPYVLAIMENGGIKPMIRKQIQTPSTHAGGTSFSMPPCCWTPPALIKAKHRCD